MWIFASQEERDQRIEGLRDAQCPHCKHVGALKRHGFLRGYDEHHFRQKTIRALRVFCSRRGSNQGCGRTFSVWIADKVKRLFLDANSLWEFLHQAATTGNKSQAFRQLGCSSGQSAIYRIWKRFLQAQSIIRTALAAICAPPSQAIPTQSLPTAQAGTPQAGTAQAGDAQAGDAKAVDAARATLEHLKAAFKESSLNPIAAYQVKTQSFFI